MFQKIITNENVFNHLLNLQTQLKTEFLKRKADFPIEMFNAVQESPKTTQWVKDMVLPRLYEGDEGLDMILYEIEDEPNLFLSATKMQMVLNILGTIEEPLANIKEATEQGEYSVKESLEAYENEQRLYKTIH